MTIYNIVEAIWVFSAGLIILVMLHSKEMELERLEDRLSCLAAPRVQNQLEPSHLGAHGDISGLDCGFERKLAK